jgi:hypothetical protein
MNEFPISADEKNPRQIFDVNRSQGAYFGRAHNRGQKSPPHSIEIKIGDENDQEPARISQF